MANKKKREIELGNVQQFEVTGVLYRKKTRFKHTYTTEHDAISAYNTAMMINLWKGTVWARLKTGKRVRLKQVNN